MTNLFDKLNLRPGERRLVVIVGVVVFVFVNIWVVMPYFGQLNIVQQQTRDTRATLDVFTKELNRTNDYVREIAQLRSRGGDVAPGAEGLELQKDVSSQALISGVPIVSYNPSDRSTSTRTNTFFDEKTLVVTIKGSGEKELVDFLHNLAAKNSLIRVRSMVLQPDQPQQRLDGNIMFVASYQKKQPAKAAAGAPAASPPAAKPAASSTPPVKATPPPARPPATGAPPVIAKPPIAPPSPGTRPAMPPPSSAGTTSDKPREAGKDVPRRIPIPPPPK